MEIEKLLSGLKCDKPCGHDNLDRRLLKLAAKIAASPICYIFNLSFNKGIYPQEWKVAKVIPLLGKLMKTIVFSQIQNYFSINSVNYDFQHAYKTGYSTCTALTKLTDDWLRQSDSKLLVGRVLLDFSTAFDIIDHDLLLTKLATYGFKLSAVTWMKSYRSYTQ